MEALEKSNMASAVAARRWLDANRQRFRGEVRHVCLPAGLGVDAGGFTGHRNVH